MAGRQLDVRHFEYRVVVPFLTPSTSPFFAPLAIDAGEMIAMELQVPSGHVGLTGFSLELAGTTIVPWGGTGGFIVADDAYLQFALGIEVDIQLAAVCYNADVFDHAFYFRIHLRDTAAYVPPAAASRTPSGLTVTTTTVALPAVPVFTPAGE